ncbi:MAG: PilC/PilY family type IV pilus protein [Nitrospirae bacterium]|nr:PilC/PilY family type IV pilus protein [Nitrospirota bacterium]
MKNIQIQNTDPIKVVVLCLVLMFSAQFVQAAADDMSNFCSIPPFVATGTKPNLLLMIDNSSSMYDLAYQDTSKTYCANAPLTVCTANADCISAGTTYCLTSTVTSTTPGTFSPKPCTVNANCTAPGSKCTSGFCTKCNTTTGVGDCTSTPAMVSVDPKTCTTNADCDAGDACNNQNLCTATRQCYDNSSYDNSQTYGGYFLSTSTYNYDFPNNKFSSVAGLPGTCTYSSGTYLCVNTSITGTVETVNTNSTGFVATGNFLNWLTASKFDIQKLILTGGKYDATTDPANPGLIAETRGCAGRKFLKSIPGVALTFAVHGGVPGGIGSTQSQATEYGQTYVEIYTGTYNEADCLLAASYWSDITHANLGPFQNASKGCVGAGNGVLDAVSMWNHILHDCYQGITGGGGGYGTNLGPLEAECKAIYADIPPGSMNDLSAGYAVCSSVLSYTDPSGNPQVGYLGACWNGTNFSGPCTPNAALNDVKQMENYCLGNINSNPVVDPSSTVIPGTGSSVPGWVMEQGLMNTVPAGTLKVKVGLATPPTGLIYTYKDSILFGAMKLNINGSRTECSSSGSVPCYKACSSTITRTCLVSTDCPSGESCVSLPATDGGQVISPVGGVCSATTSQFCTDDINCPYGETCTISIGNHGSGLIHEIDNIVASSWTSVGEGFYEAIGYFAQNQSSPSQSKDFRLQTGTCSVTTSLTCNPADTFPCPSPETCQTGITKGDYNITKNPSSAWCRSNNIMIITDGMSTADQNSGPTNLVQSNGNNYPAPYTNSSNYGNCSTYKGSSNLAGLAWIAKNKKINDSAFTSSTISSVTPTLNNQSINTYVVYTGPTTNTGIGLCDAYTLMQKTAANGGTTLYTAASTTQLYASLNQALGSIAAKAASGSAVSVLTTSARGVGSMLQAYFFPTSKLGSGKDLSWLGYTQNIWIDTKDNLRDDYSGTGTSDAHLILSQDRVMMMNVDPASNATKVGLFSTLADGTAGSLASCATTTVEDFNQIIPLWEGGNKLAQVTASDDGTERNIFTAIPGGTGMGAAGGITFNRSTVTGNATLSAALNPDSTYTAAGIVRYTRGVALETFVISGASYTNFRDRTQDDGSVWKLGDVINSTPKVVGNIPQNTYFIDYGDATYYKFISSDDFRHRSSIAIIGANDGMLHSFRVGYLKDRTENSVPLGTNEKALFRDYYGAADSVNTHLGEETWAYIPYNILPYLKYYASQNYPGCHIYGVDLTLKVYDASIGDGSVAAASAAKATDGSSWRTIVIGGMRFGGACSSGTNPTGPPIAGAGFSSYFALDLTDYLKDTGNIPPGSAVTLPKPLWEFTDAANGYDLGYTTSAPAIVRTGPASQNGNWYVVFGSGPTQLPTSNPNRDIDRNRQGYIYILNLATGALIKKIPLDHNAVVSDVLAIDADKDYQSEKLYFGTTYENGASWAGKLMSITLPSNFDVNDICGAGSGATPTYALCSGSSLKTLFSGNYPFTASPDVAKDDLGNIWVYAGSGKYNSSLDEQDSSPQVFLGLIDNSNLPKTASGSSATACPSSATCSSLTALCNVSLCTTSAFVPTQGGTTQICTFDGNTSSFKTIVTTVTNAVSTTPQSNAGWVIFLPDSKERVVSRPLAVGGVVDFLSYVPSTTVCTKGGNSYLYAVDYKTGGPPTNVAIRAVGATSGTSGNVDLYRRVLLGPGAPPTGEAIIITPPKEGQEKLKKKIQVSTGVIVETENKPMISTISKIINWLKK